MRPQSAYETFKQFWGLTPSWEVLWNAIPFSFLLDYGISIGKAIKYSTPYNQVSSETTQYCESTLCENSGGQFLWLPNNSKKQYIFIPSSPSITTLSKPSFVAGIQRSIYERNNTMPHIYGMYVPVPRGPSIKQWGNLAALLRVLF
jgi:hypothetical protein